MAYNKTKNKFSWLDYETDDDEVKVTSNPLRKLKKKIRRIEERLKKNPSPELENELSELKEKVLIYEKKEKSSKPKKKKFKKKKFKKKKIDKAKNAKEKKWAREKRFEEMKERERQERKKWNKDREREEKKRKTVDIRIKNEKAKQILSKYSTINNIPMDIITWIDNTTKKGYYNLVKKYHPDKNKSYNIDCIKFINEWWHKSKKVSFVFCK